MLVAAQKLSDRYFAAESQNIVTTTPCRSSLATRMAATRISDATLAELDGCLRQMSEAGSQEELVQFDEEFHHLVATTTGNATLASMLTGVSSRTTRGRAWRGIVEASATERTISEHAAILAALRARDPQRAEAAALLHVSTTEAWFRSVLEAEAGEPGAAPGHAAEQ